MSLILDSRLSHLVINQELKRSFLFKIAKLLFIQIFRGTCALLFECVSVRDKLPIRYIIEVCHARGAGKMSPLKVCFSGLYCFSNYFVLCEVVPRNGEITDSMQYNRCKVGTFMSECYRESGTLELTVNCVSFDKFSLHY